MNFTNSPLVKHTNISPHKTAPRNAKIDTITIHCVVGQVTAESLGSWFKQPNTQASSNYGVDKDGRVGLYVDEKDRSWCTSSGANDNRAVTIEVASDTTHPYAVTDKAFSGLLDLVTDICKRNGIVKLLWKGDKALIGQVDKQNLTVHRWFANKSCPGDYLYNLHGKIADEVNKRLNAAAPTPEQPSTPTQTTGANDEIIWNFLKGKGLNDFAVAGIMGNLYAESGLKPNNLQNIYEKSLGFTDESYTAAVDNGSYTNFVRDSAGYGLAQWTYWSRKENLLQFARLGGKSIGDLQTQLEFLWRELQEYTAVMTVLNNAKSVLEASNVVLTQYEKPADTGASVQAKRADYGQGYYNKFATKTATPSTPEPEKPAVADWAREAWAWGIENKFFDGTRPTDPITRQETITLFYRFLTMLGR